MIAVHEHGGIVTLKTMVLDGRNIRLRVILDHNLILSHVRRQPASKESKVACGDPTLINGLMDSVNLPRDPNLGMNEDKVQQNDMQRNINAD